jgi:hypothetical protein
MSQIIDSYTVTEEGEKLSGLPTILDTLIGETAADGVNLRLIIEEVFLHYIGSTQLDLGDAKTHQDKNSHILEVVHTLSTPQEAKIVAGLLVRTSGKRGEMA